MDRIGDFQILGTLGKGAHSTILHVRRSADGKQYALKVVPIRSKADHKFLEQAEHEFRIAQKLDHPNLIKVFAIEKLKTLGFFGVREVRLLIEYVNGRTLETFGILPLPQMVQVFVQVASALVHMHRRQVFHADLKPSNIMLSRTGEVKVIDYGLAWTKGEDKGRVQGTPEYMAPEQVKNRIVNEKTDIFNFGATMYRLCTWTHVPSVISSGAALTGSVWESQLRPVRACNPQVPPALAAIIEKSLAYHPLHRFDRMSEIQGALDHLADDLVQTDDDKLDALEWKD